MRIGKLLRQFSPEKKYQKLNPMSLAMLSKLGGLLMRVGEGKGKLGKQMNTIGIALISFGVGLIISLKLMKEDEKKRKRGKRDV